MRRTVRFVCSLGCVVLLWTAARAQEEPAAPAGGSKVVTNRELEPLRRRREAQEAEYERTRRERGLPSMEELRRQFEERDRRLSEWALRAESERRQADLAALRLRALLSLSQPRPTPPADVYAETYAAPFFYPYNYGAPVLSGRFGHFGQRGRHFGFSFPTRRPGFFPTRPSAPRGFGPRPSHGRAR